MSPWAHSADFGGDNVHIMSWLTDTDICILTYSSSGSSLFCLALLVYPRPPLISRPWALRKVTLSLWWCFDSSLPLLSPPTLPSHPLSPNLLFLFLTGKLESHYHQGAKKGLVPSTAEWCQRGSWRGNLTRTLPHYPSGCSNILRGDDSADILSIGALAVVHHWYFHFAMNHEYCIDI